MYFYNRELYLLQPFRLRWYYSKTQRINIMALPYAIYVAVLRTGDVCLKGRHIARWCCLNTQGIAIRYICCSPSDWCCMPERLLHI